MHYEIKTQYSSPDLPVREVDETHGRYQLVQVDPIKVSTIYNNGSKNVLKFEYDLVEGKVYSFGYESESFFIIVEDELVQVQEGSWEWIAPKGIDKLVRRYHKENYEKQQTIERQQVTINELKERVAKLECDAK